MFRRHFMQKITCAAATLFGTAEVSHARERKIVLYQIKGFTCVTCAVGLETMMKRQEGVLRAEASYPEANALIEFDPGVITEKTLKEFIGEMGFGVEAAAEGMNAK